MGRIRAEAEKHGWTIRDDQLADKNLISVYPQASVYGVDKNPMAVELAKVSAVAAHVYRWCAALLPRSSSQMRRFPLRRMGT